MFTAWFRVLFRPWAQSRKNVLILSACQALSVSCAVILVTVTTLVGMDLAPDPTLATLPYALQMVAAMSCTYGASILMGRVGRRMGFTIGQGIGVLGVLLALMSIMMTHSYVLFCLSSLLFGGYMAFWHYYRFAAVDGAEESFRPRAISLVLAGGVVAAWAGPEISKYSVEMVDNVLYAGTYVAMSVLMGVNIILLQFLKIPRPAAKKTTVKNQAGRSLADIIAQPTCIAAILSGTIGYGLMALVMTATPLSMETCGFDFSGIATVIQWHVLAMYAPSFVTGILIHRFGAVAIILAGCVSYGGTVWIALSGIEFAHFWSALVLLGIGWNFTYTGGSTLLSQTWREEEKPRVQAINDTLIFATTSTTSLLSGVILSLYGWDIIVASMSIPVLFLIVALIIHRIKMHRSRHRTTPNVH